MKRFACTLLALITAFSLCACDNDDDDDRRDRSDKKKNTAVEEVTEAPTVVEEPNDKEADALYEYISAVCCIKAELARIQQDPSNYNADYIQEYCRKVQEFAYTSKWAKTNRAADILQGNQHFDIPFDPETDWDSAAVLAQFTTVKDVVLYRTETTTDNLGNQSDANVKTFWHYNSKGQASQIIGEDNIPFSLASCIGRSFSEGIREYDQAGRLVKITTYSGDTIIVVCTYKYNTEGQMTNITIKENTQTYEINDIRYDAQGHLTYIEWKLQNNDEPHAMIYTYNTDGTVAMVENITYVTNDNQERFPKFRTAMEYTYENGKAVSGTYTNQSYGEWFNFSVGVTSTWVGNETIDTYEFSYDNAGRLVEEVATHGSTKTYNSNGDMTNENSPYYATTTYTTVYGDYYAPNTK